MCLHSAKLWVVATPLGNPGDLSPRAREVLEGADTILAEDTRRTGDLFKRCGLTPRRLSSFHDHNEVLRLEEVLNLIRTGQHVALVSDAGMPVIADPGYRLVRACRQEGIPVSVIPGPSAPLTALAGSGIPPLPFTFLGFLPRGRAEQEKLFAPFANLRLTLIFFERKDRLAETLHTARAVLGPRELCVARELTKTHEEYVIGRLEEDLPKREWLGELTVILGPAEVTETTSQERLAAVIAEERLRGSNPRDVARRVQARVHGWTVKAIYAMMTAESGSNRKSGEHT